MGIEKEESQCKGGAERDKGNLFQLLHLQTGTLGRICKVILVYIPQCKVVYIV